MQNQTFKVHLLIANSTEIHFCGLKAGVMGSFTVELKHPS